MKSELQERAETLARRCSSNLRKSVVIEFAGVPKAGKTTILTSTNSFLKRCGFHPEIVVERASMCPIRDKKHSNFNVWTASTTLSQILEKTQEPPLNGDPNILLLDRGIFDSICWLSVMEQTARIVPKDKQAIEAFLLLEDWRRRIKAVVLMLASPKDSMERERGLLPVEGVQGSIMNTDMLQLTLDVTNETADRLRRYFRIFKVDTSHSKGISANETAELVVSHILDVIEEQIREDILCLPKSQVTTIFNGTVCIGEKKAATLIEEFLSNGEFRARDEIEKDSGLLQALPIVVVRNKQGDILQLRRREKSEDNPLHEKVVIWAGGHVRSEDKHNGNSIIQCIMRELKEELRLNILEKDLTLLGAIYSDVGKRTSNHVAIVYEWRTHNDDVNVALCSAEFFERRGTSLSGKFVDLDTVRKLVKEQRDSEVWSEEILEQFLEDRDSLGQKRLLS